MRSSSSAKVIIASNGDLLTELHLCLPVKSLLRFKCVSKHWLSLISDPRFIARKSFKPSAASALYVNCWSPDSHGYPIFRNSNQVVPLDHPYSQTIISANFSRYGTEILHSCNGLLCCLNSWTGDYCVCNPTTKRFTTLPPIPVSGFHLVLGVNLAFDPSKSPFYKVVCVQESRQLPYYHCCQILIYSRETGHWRASGAPFTNLLSLDFFNGVYWNGALYWASQVKPSLMYFDMSQEILRELPLPSLSVIVYFGESRGHLHLVGHNNNSTPTQFNVYEMETDRWFLKFSIDFSWMVQSYPDLIPPKLLSLVRGEKEQDSFLVMCISNGRVLRYNFTRQTHTEIWNIGCTTTHNSRGQAAGPFLMLRSLGPVVFQYTESLSLV